MDIEPLPLPGAFTVTLDPRCDERGYFMRTYDETLFLHAKLVTAWAQENESWSHRRGQVRGLHFQHPPHAETKLVRVCAGAIFDVLVDLRRGSPTYGRWEGVELSATNHRMAYIPKGFAHGFCALTDGVLVQYRVDAPYAPAFEGGLRWDDPDLAIAWPVGEVFVSAKDAALGSFAQFESRF